MTAVQSRRIGFAAIALAVAFPLGVVVEMQRTCPDPDLVCFPVVLDTIFFWALIATPFLAFGGAVVAIRGRAKVVGGLGLVLSAIDLLLFAGITLLLFWWVKD